MRQVSPRQTIRECSRATDHHRFPKAFSSLIVIQQGLLLFFGTFCCIPLTAQSASPSSNQAVMSQLHQAIAIADHGDESRALALARELLQQHPNFEPALKFQAALLEDLGNNAEAIAAYQAALKLEPTDPELLFKVGLYQLQTSHPQGAIGLFTRALKYSPTDRDTLYYLSQAYHLNGDNDLALKTIQQCLKVDPGNASVWQKYGELLCSSGDNQAALTWLLKAQQSDPTLDRIDFDLGVASYRNMDLDHALAYSSQAAQRRPADLNAQALLATVYMKLGKWQDAEPIFRTILQSKSDDVPSLLGLGQCGLELKNYQQSADLLEQLLREDPTQILAHFYLSRAYTGLGKTKDAQYEAELHRTMLEQASSSGSHADTDQETKVWNQARQLLLDNQESTALQLFRTQSNGPFATPAGSYVLLGTLYSSMNRSTDAERCLHKALEIDPTIRGAHTSLGIEQLQQSNLDKAESEFKSELALHPNDQAALAELGEVRYHQGRWADAANLLSKSKTMVPSLLFILCDAYFHLGNIKDADLTAELLVAYSKHQPEAVKGVVELLNRNQQLDLAQKLQSKQPS
ncbi:MAG: tetratricopeptide repeat protein [Acidobacteriota bacterium]|nr:tetratricopeptide repeat protein [Acidobacteriota bacterium]